MMTISGKAIGGTGSAGVGVALPVECVQVGMGVGMSHIHNIIVDNWICGLLVSGAGVVVDIRRQLRSHKLHRQK